MERAPDLIESVPLPGAAEIGKRSERICRRCRRCGMVPETDVRKKSLTISITAYLSCAATRAVVKEAVDQGVQTVQEYAGSF